MRPQARALPTRLRPRVSTKSRGHPLFLPVVLGGVPEGPPLSTPRTPWNQKGTLTAGPSGPGGPSKSMPCKRETISESAPPAQGPGQRPPSQQGSAGSLLVGVGGLGCGHGNWPPSISRSSGKAGTVAHGPLRSSSISPLRCREESRGEPGPRQGLSCLPAGQRLRRPWVMAA